MRRNRKETFDNLKVYLMIGNWIYVSIMHWWDMLSPIFFDMEIKNSRFFIQSSILFTHYALDCLNSIHVGFLQNISRFALCVRWITHSNSLVYIRLPVHFSHFFLLRDGRWCMCNISQKHEDILHRPLIDRVSHTISLLYTLEMPFLLLDNSTAWCHFDLAY